MATIEVSHVRAILETDISDADLQVYIGAADQLFADNLAGQGISTATEIELKRYLACHFATATRDIEAGSMIEFSADSVRVRVGGALRGGIFGPGLLLTRYGQTALILDPTGILSSIAEGKPQATFAVPELPEPDDE